MVFPFGIKHRGTVLTIYPDVGVFGSDGSGICRGAVTALPARQGCMDKVVHREKAGC